jgi:hypothetical protein
MSGANQKNAAGKPLTEAKQFNFWNEVSRLLWIAAID